MNHFGCQSVAWIVIGLAFMNHIALAGGDTTKPRPRAFSPGTYTVDPIRLMHHSARGNSQQDLNGNGIPDSLDIHHGFAQDMNHNGIIDDHDPDDAIMERALTYDRWWRFADSPDSIYFGITYTDDPDVTIRYTVPPGGSSVQLAVRDSAGSQLLGWIVNQTQAQGPYTVEWNREFAGKRLGPGTYTFRLMQRGKFLDRRMWWRSK